MIKSSEDQPEHHECIMEKHRAEFDMLIEEIDAVFDNGRGEIFGAEFRERWEQLVGIKSIGLLSIASGIPNSRVLERIEEAACLTYPKHNTVICFRSEASRFDEDKSILGMCKEIVDSGYIRLLNPFCPYKASQMDGVYDGWRTYALGLDGSGLISKLQAIQFIPHAIGGLELMRNRVLGSLFNPNALSYAACMSSNEMAGPAWREFFKWKESNGIGDVSFL